MQADIIIIGAGPGGYETALAAAHAGRSVVIIERGPLGGTCLNSGCIPTKCLCRSAEIAEDLRHAADFGVSTGLAPDAVSVDLAAAVARKDSVVEKLREGVAALMRTPGITLLRGTARFVDAHTVEVSGEELDGSPVSVTAPAVILATGSVTKFLPIPGAHSAPVITSTELLTLSALPASIVIIGGGVIGLEAASIMSAFGVREVSVVEYCKEVLPNFDRDIAKRLRLALQKRGIAFYTSAAATEIRPLEGGAGAEVVFQTKGKEDSVSAELVLMAVGRAAAVDSLNLADAGIDFTPRGVVVDGHMQTSVAGVYAIGDLNGLCQLAHAAAAQGRTALRHILGQSDVDAGPVPAAVFTLPEAAMVGRTEEQLKADGVSFTARKALYRSNGKALAMGADDGVVKVLTDADGHVLGASILGAHAADLIHELTLAMSAGLTVVDIAAAVHAHPTLSELLCGLA